MGLIENVERGLEKAVRGVFKAGSKGRIEPVDVASRLRSEMDKKSYAIAEGRTIAPNVFTVEFSDADFPRAQDWGYELAEELCDVAIRHARSQGYTLRGAVRVTFTRTKSDELQKGEFLVLSSQERSGRSAGQGRGGASAAASPARQQTRYNGGQDYGRRPESPVGRQATQAPTDRSEHYAPGGAPDYGHSSDAAYAAPVAAAAASNSSLPSGSSRIAPRTPSRRDQAQQYSSPDATQVMNAPGGHGASRRNPTNYKPVLDINGQRFSIQATSIVLGRSSEADITIEDTGVSRRHLEILNQDGVFLAVDLGSTNGSTIDGTRLRGRHELVDGTVITMGRTKITFRLLAPRSSH
ncbi:FhaA domain-containing protein [Kocuria massiliensis]|uniref:FhaA domain-containing protein n=1 Tax=Kocuria massiliensis TaxID=1926282 RepID=UPI001FECF54F|nr:DUF3662 and FHA domain-containing protein [Kocuria massiliensis]